jgi:hypothetical protein
MPNLIYTNPEAAIVFTEVSGDVVFTPKNLGNLAGRVSAQLDRGAGAKAMRYRWEAKFSVQSSITPGAAGVQVELWIATAHSAAASVDSGLGQADAALTARNQLLMAMPVGVVVPHGTAAGVGPFNGSGYVDLYARYISVAYWNATGVSLTNVNGDNVVRLIPIPDEIQ